MQPLLVQLSGEAARALVVLRRHSGQFLVAHRAIRPDPTRPCVARMAFANGLPSMSRASVAGRIDVEAELIVDSCVALLRRCFLPSTARAPGLDFNLWATYCNKGQTSLDYLIAIRIRHQRGQPSLAYYLAAK